jgi:hypothetical protein
VSARFIGTHLSGSPIPEHRSKFLAVISEHRERPSRGRFMTPLEASAIVFAANTLGVLAIYYVLCRADVVRHDADNYPDFYDPNQRD